VRVLAATSRNLEQLIARGDFREDLYYRLAEVAVQLPPLRERLEDVPALAAAILRQLGESVALSRQTEAFLANQEWPGNVRELRNKLKRAVALSLGADLLQVVHFVPPGHGGATVPPSAVELEFPPHVAEHAERLWKAGEPPSDADATRYEQRALQRAALICLAAREPFEAWPRALVTQWKRLFGERWATTEGGRGLRELARELGVDGRDQSVRERVLGVVNGVRH
jgi:DNA-binding NtrC family response regulator